VKLLYQQSEIFDDHLPDFDEKIVAYKINDKIYIKIIFRENTFSGIIYERT